MDICFLILRSIWFEKILRSKNYELTFWIFNSYWVFDPKRFVFESLYYDFQLINSRIIQQRFLFITHY